MTYSRLQIIQSINRVIKELENLKVVLNEDVSKINIYRTRCERCKLLDVRIRKDGSYFCKACGLDTKEDELDKELKEC